VGACLARGGPLAYSWGGAGRLGRAPWARETAPRTEQGSGQCPRLHEGSAGTGVGGNGGVNGRGEGRRGAGGSGSRRRRRRRRSSSSSSSSSGSSRDGSAASIAAWRRGAGEGEVQERCGKKVRGMKCQAFGKARGCSSAGRGRGSATSRGWGGWLLLLLLLLLLVRGCLCSLCGAQHCRQRHAPCNAKCCLGA
jgi:hypothetical protein